MRSQYIIIDDDHFTQANEDVSKNLQQIKGILSGDAGV